MFHSFWILNEVRGRQVKGYKKLWQAGEIRVEVIENEHLAERKTNVPEKLMGLNDGWCCL